MQDRNGKDVCIGQIVKIVGNYDVPMHNYWIVDSFFEYPTAIDVVLVHFHTNEVRFIPILDIECPFGE